MTRPLDYADLQAALKTSRGKVTLRAKLDRLDMKWRVARDLLAKAEAACAQTANYTPDSPSRQWAESARAEHRAMIDRCRAELAAILSGGPAQTAPADHEPVESVAQAAMF